MHIQDLSFLWFGVADFSCLLSSKRISHLGLSAVFFTYVLKAWQHFRPFLHHKPLSKEEHLQAGIWGDPHITTDGRPLKADSLTSFRAHLRRHHSHPSYHLWDDGRQSDHRTAARIRQKFIDIWGSSPIGPILRDDTIFLPTLPFSATCVVVGGSVAFVRGSL